MPVAPYQNPWLMMQGPDGQTFGPQDFLNAQNTQANTGPLPQALPPMPAPMSTPAPAAAPGVKMPSMDAMNALIKQADLKNIEGAQINKDAISRLQNYRQNMPQGPQGVDLTGLMMLADHFNKNNQFVNAYKAPETGSARAEKSAAIDKEIGTLGGKLTDDEINLLKEKMMGETAKLHYGTAKAAMDSQKNADNEEKDAKDLMKFLDTEKASGRFTPIGKAQGNLFQAQRIQALIDQYKEDPNKMPLNGPSSLSEVAIGLNNLISANGGSEESRKSLIPASARGKYSTVEQFIKNEPVGADMGEFVKNAQDVLKREMITNQGQINKYQQRIKTATGGGRLSKSNPERYNAILGAYLTPEGETEAPSAPAAPAGPSRDDIAAELKRRGKL